MTFDLLKNFMPGGKPTFFNAEGGAGGVGAPAGEGGQTVLGGAANQGNGAGGNTGEGSAPGEPSGTPADGAAGVGDVGESGVPEAYDLGAFTEMGLPDNVLETIGNAYREAGLSQDQVNALAAAEAAMNEQLDTLRAESLNEQAGEWFKAAQSDPELGENWDLTSQRVAAGLKELGADDAFIQLMEETALGSHPLIVKAIARVGQVASNDVFENANTAGEKVPTEASWYGDTTPSAKKG